MAQTESEIVQGIGSDYEVKYGFNVPEDYFFKAAAASRTSSSTPSPRTRASPTGCGSSATSRSTTSSRARCRRGAAGRRSRTSTSTTSSTTSSRPRIRPTAWADLPADIKDTWDKLGIPEAEKKYLAGVGAQYESEVVYHKLQESLEKKGVIFLDMDSALRDHEDIVKQYMGTIIPQNDNKFAALNSAVWSGGSFIYVPPGVHIDLPLQAYFRINAENMGQFERTLIIVDEDAYVHYVEGLHRADLLVRLAALARSSRSSSRRAAGAATRRSRTGRRTSTTSSPSARSRRRTRRWNGSTGTSGRS